MNTKIKYTIVVLLTFFVTTTYAQLDTLKSVLKPRVGGSVGVLAYYGEVQNYQKGFSPLVNRVAGSVFLNAPLSSGFNLEFTAMFGKVGANERGLERNLNFESRIRSGSMMLNYNFYHLLKNTHRNFTPFVGVGITSFEFLSKTDLYDASGNRYFYWNDGSIMSLSQLDPLASTADEMYRDYTYETDLREQNFDSLGKYREQSFAIPISIGGEWHITSRVDFRLSTTLNYTFTDLIDNVSAAGTGNRKGDSKNDHFMFTSFALSYDLEFGKQEEELNDNVGLEDDWTGFSQSDLDNDGIIDAFDKCPKTPLEAKVDRNGCPLDTDKDGVEDYFDEEPNTPEGNYVDQYGVTLTDEDIRMQVLMFNDSTGEYHEWNEDFKSSNPRGDVIKITKVNDSIVKQVPTSYVVIVGKEEKSDTEEEMHKYLGFDDFNTIEKEDTTYYVIGEYELIEDAVAAKISLENEGVDVQSIGKTNNDATVFTEIENDVVKKVEKVNIKSGKELPSYDDTEQVYRVQLGAFKNKIDTDETFPGIKDLVSVKGADGVTRYYTGNFDNHKEANTHKNILRKNGHDKSFVVAYQGHKRVTLKEVGAELPDDYDEQKEIDSFVEPRVIDTLNTIDGTQNSNIDMSKVKYRVFLGAFEAAIPVEVIDVYMNIGGVRPYKEDNHTSYYSKSVSSESNAEALLNDYEMYGLKDLKVMYEYLGKYYSKADFLKLSD